MRTLAGQEQLDDVTKTPNIIAVSLVVFDKTII